MPKTTTKRCENIHQLTREVGNWCEHYRNWSASDNATGEMVAAHMLLDRITQEMVELFGDPSDAGE